jgi:membrane fusion protein (multidrug efflux system)
LSLGKQILLATLLLLAVAGGGYLYVRSQTQGEAVAAIRRGPSAVPVTVVPAAVGTVRDRIEAVGSTLARQAVDIVPLVSGRVVEIGFAPGDQVASAAALVRLDGEAERAAVAEARATLRAADLALGRARKLMTRKNVSQATVDELEAGYLGAKARLDQVEKRLAERTIRAPFAGVVGMRGVDIGARVDDETVLTTLDDLVEVEIEFNVPEDYFGRVRIGHAVTATTTAFAGRAFSGRVAAIDSRIGQVSRAFRVRATVPNPDLLLPAGMFMHVEVVLGERSAVLIPEESILAEGSSTYVFTVADDRAGRRDVRLGQREADSVEVLDGLRPGDVVVRKGVHRLRDGSPVRIADEAERGSTTAATDDGT